MPESAAADIAFDQALRGHAEYFLTNYCRAFIYGISASHLAPSPYPGRIGDYYRRLGQMSAAFAVCADLVLRGSRRRLRFRKEQETDSNVCAARPDQGFSRPDRGDDAFS